MDWIYMRCPVANCTNSLVTYWYHHNCGDKLMFRYSDINAVCSGCYRSNIIFQWAWYCGQHPGGFRKPTKLGIINGFAGWVQASSGISNQVIRDAVRRLYSHS